MRVWPFSLAVDEVNRLQDVGVITNQEKEKITAIDAQEKTVVRTEEFTHTYDFGLKGLTLKIADGDVERKPVPEIAYTTHVS